MRKSIALLTVLPMLGGAAGSAAAGDPPVTKAATRTVELGDNFFTRPGRTRSIESITVRKNDIIKFMWGPNNEGTADFHNVAGVRGNKFDATEDTMRPDRPFRKRFTKSSVVVCTIHPTTMELRVKVKRPRR